MRLREINQLSQTHLMAKLEPKPESPYTPSSALSTMYIILVEKKSVGLLRIKVFQLSSLIKYTMIGIW